LRKGSKLAISIISNPNLGHCKSLKPKKHKAAQSAALCFLGLKLYNLSQAQSAVVQILAKELYMLDKRDYTLIIDKSGSMSNTDRGTNKSRWEIVKESTLALARKCDQLDPDGITVYLFSGKFKRYDNVSAVKVEQIFQENDPMGGTNLTAVLQHYSHYQRE